MDTTAVGGFSNKANGPFLSIPGRSANAGNMVPTIGGHLEGDSSRPEDSTISTPSWSGILVSRPP